MIIRSEYCKLVYIIASWCKIVLIRLACSNYCEEKLIKIEIYKFARHLRITINLILNGLKICKRKDMFHLSVKTNLE